LRLISKISEVQKNNTCVILGCESVECMRLEAGGMANMELIEQVVPNSFSSSEYDVSNLLGSSRGNTSPLFENSIKIALQIFIRFLKKNNKNIKTIAVGDNYNDLDMLKKSDFPCLVFNDKFTLDEIPINNLITTNKPSPEGWADVIKMALVKINEN